MMMMNSFILLGRIVSLSKTNDNKGIITIKYTSDDGDLSIPVYVLSDLLEKHGHYLEEGALISFKGKIDADENGLILIAEKTVFLARRNENEN